MRFKRPNNKVELADLQTFLEKKLVKTSYQAFLITLTTRTRIKKKSIVSLLSSILSAELIVISNKSTDKNKKLLLVLNSIIGYNTNIGLGINHTIKINMEYEKLEIKQLTLINLPYCLKTFISYKNFSDYYYIARDRKDEYTDFLYLAEDNLFSNDLTNIYRGLTTNSYNLITILNLLGWYMTITEMTINNGKIYKKNPDFESSWFLLGDFDQWLNQNLQQILGEMSGVFYVELYSLKLEYLFYLHQEKLMNLVNNKQFFETCFANNIIELENNYFDLQTRKYLEKKNKSYNTSLFAKQNGICKSNLVLLDRFLSSVMFITEKKDKITFVIDLKKKVVIIKVSKLQNIPEKVPLNYSVICLSKNLIFGFEKKDLIDIGTLEIKLNNFIDESLCCALLTGIIVATEEKKEIINIVDLI